MSVYFIVCREANAVKIGTSIDPHDRLREIQRCCPLPVQVEAALPGHHQEEFALHERFADARLHGEWFRLTPAIEAMIAANPPPPAIPPQERIAMRRMEAAGYRPKANREREKERERHTAKVRREQRRDGERSLARRLAAGDITFPFRGPVA